MKHTSEKTKNKKESILLTGATGYIGGRLLKLLESEGHRVRCLSRYPKFLDGRVNKDTEVVRGDVLDINSIKDAMKGIQTAYYLVHSMAFTGKYEETDRKAAQNFSKAAKACGVKRIIYVGGLTDSRLPLSSHMRSRQEVGNLLRASGVETIEFQASVVIGSGSLSFELVRALVERLPVMVTPRWVSVLAQPIAITDLLQYLISALYLSSVGNKIFEVGGPDQISYRELMKEYGRQRHLRRIMISVPFLTPRLSSWWLKLVTPMQARVGRALIDSMTNPSVVKSLLARDYFDIQPIGVSQGIAQALRYEDQEVMETRWNEALSSGNIRMSSGGMLFRNRVVDSQSIYTEFPPGVVFKRIEQIGGTTGYYYGNWLWALRGFLDSMIGGVGLRRGRRDPKSLRIGDVVDFWRVLNIEPGRRLQLQAEMRLPGRGRLEFEVDENGDGSSIRQTVTFDPVGLTGLAYWYILYPIHALIFRGMLKGIVSNIGISSNEGLT